MLKMWVEKPLPYAFAEGTILKMTEEQWEKFKEEKEPIYINEGWLVVRNDEDVEIIITKVGKYRFSGYIYYKKEQELYQGTILPPASKYWGRECMKVDEKGNWFDVNKSKINKHENKGI